MKISITQEQKTPCIYHTYQCYGIKNKYNTDIYELEPKILG